MADTTTHNNLLVHLHKWALRQNENFFTDAFAHLLRHLCDHQPGSAASLLSDLTDGHLCIAAKDVAKVKITTQVTTEQGRPDLEISTPDHLVFVEAKMESLPGGGQLDRYLQDLKSRGVARTSLVLLTRYPVRLPSDHERSVVSRRWYEIADWLQSDGTPRDEVTTFLIKQFVEFLKVRDVALNKVTRDVVGGLKPLMALMAMLENAIRRCIARKKLKNCRFEFAPPFIGFRIDGGKYYMGVEDDAPGVMLFATWDISVRDDAAEVAGCGEVIPFEDSDEPQWVNEFDMNAEEGHFFALSEGKQMQRIEQFLGTCLEALPSVKVKKRK